MDPRIVVVRRTTEYESLLKEHGTPQMVAFKLKQQGLELGPVKETHHTMLSAAESVLGSVPTTWRRAWVLREELDRFRFDPDDIIMAVGADGLVPNVAKYLNGQPVCGINPFSFAQKMMKWAPSDTQKIYREILPNIKDHLERRTMAKVTLSGGQSIVAMNEIFCGHRSHQSAKYDISHEGKQEYHSSSGLIVFTGTGMTGWALSLKNSMKIGDEMSLPPNRPRLRFLVREAWTGPGTGTEIQQGEVSPSAPLTVVSKTQEGGVLFGDGIESDFLEFNWGAKAVFAPAEQVLRLVAP